MGVKVKIYIDSLNDEWEYRLGAALKTNVVNSGQMGMMPWERLAHEVRGIPNVTGYTKIPDQHLCQYAAARGAALEFLKDTDGDPTLKDMQRIISGKQKHLKQLDRTYDLDIAFLMEDVGDLACAKVREQIINSLPTPQTPISMKKAPPGVPVDITRGGQLSSFPSPQHVIDLRRRRCHPLSGAFSFGSCHDFIIIVACWDLGRFSRCPQ